MFSFALVDESVTPTRMIAARDPIGITTLYQGWSSSRPGAVYFASELKALVNECDKIISFPPGHVWDSRDNSTTRYYKPSWWNGDAEGPEATIPTTPADLKLLRETLEAAVRKRLMSEVPYGVLLSGGLDSSLIASIAARETEKVAQAQYEIRKRKLQEQTSGPSTPTGNGLITEQGSYYYFKFENFPSHTYFFSDVNFMASASFLFHRSRKLSRSPGRAEGCAFPRDGASRVRIYRAGRTGCYPRGDIPSRDIRCHHRPGEYTHVFA